MTAWFCKVGHHLGATKYKISKPLSSLLMSKAYHTFPETARGGKTFTGGVIREAYADKNRYALALLAAIALPILTTLSESNEA